jgi:hypothetical protein
LFSWIQNKEPHKQLWGEALERVGWALTLGDQNSLELPLETMMQVAGQGDRLVLPTASSSPTSKFPSVTFQVTRLPSQNFDFECLFVLALKKMVSLVTF